MALTIKTVQRRYSYNGQRLPVVPGMSEADLLRLWSDDNDDLLNAELIEGEIVDGVQEVTLRRKVGTKG